MKKIFLRPALITGLLLLIPLIAMQFTPEVRWTLSDFVIMGALIFGTGFLVETILRTGARYRLLLAVLAGLAFLWLWIELAVGLVTDWGS